MSEPGKEIIFFDELGFGWVVDKEVIGEIIIQSPDKEIIVEKTLDQLLNK